MATITKAASAHTAITTGYTNPTNAFTDDSVYATAAPGKNAEISAYWGFPAFTSLEIPDGSVINSVKVAHQFKCSTTSSVATEYCQLFLGTTAVGTEQSNAAEPAADTELAHTVTSGVAVSDLRTADYLRCRTRSARGNSNTAVTFSLDYIYVTVDYTAPQTLAGNNCTQDETSSTGAISQTHALAGANASLAAICAAGAISQAHALAGAACTQDATCSTGAVVGAVIDLAGSTSSQPNVSGTGAIAQTHLVAGADSSQANGTSVGAAAQAHQMVCAASTQAQTSSAGEISQQHNLAAQTSGQANTSGVGASAQTHQLAGVGDTQANETSISGIGSSVTLAGSTSSQPNASGTGTILQIHSLLVDVAAQETGSGAGTISQAHALQGASCAQANASDSGAVQSAGMEFILINLPMRLVTALRTEIALAGMAMVSGATPIANLKTEARNV